MQYYKSRDEIEALRAESAKSAETFRAFGSNMDSELKALAKSKKPAEIQVRIEEKQKKKEEEEQAEKQAKQAERQADRMAREASKQSDKLYNPHLAAWNAKQEKDKKTKLKALISESKPSEEFEELKKRLEQLVEFCSRTSNDTLTHVRDNPKAFSEKEFDEITYLIDRARYKLFETHQSLLNIRDRIYPEVEETPESEELNDKAIAEYAKQQKALTHEYLGEEAA